MEAASLPKENRDAKPRRFTLRARLILLFVVLALSVAFILVAAGPQRIQFSPETSLEFLGVTIGTNAFIYGNSLEKILGDRIPAKGLNLGPFKLRRPGRYVVDTDGAPLAARILIRGPREHFGEWFSRDSKVITANSSGRQLENPNPLPSLSNSNEMLLTVPLFAFPRDEREVRLRLSPSRNGSAERRWIEFRFPNPFRQPPAEWKPTPLPITNVAGGGQFILHQQLSNPTRLIFLLPSKGWRLAECKIHDPEGNLYRSRRLDNAVSDFKTVMPFTHSFERDRIWKVTASFVAASVNTNQFGPRYDVAQIDSDQDLRFHIAANTELALTNRTGTTYSCTFDGQNLAIRNATNHAEQTPFIILSATDDLRRDVNFVSNFDYLRPPRRPPGGQTWQIGGTPILPIQLQQHRVTNISVYLVAPKTVETVFYIDPAISIHKYQ